MFINKNNLKDNVNKANTLKDNEVTTIPLMMCRPKSYTGNGKMRQMIRAKHRMAPPPPNVYIVNCTTISDISYMNRNPLWYRL